jgi:hypothetical protein
MNDQAHFFLGVAYREKGMYEQAAMNLNAHCRLTVHWLMLTRNWG